MPPIPKNNNNAPFSIPTLFLFFAVISILTLAFFFSSSSTTTTISHRSLTLQPLTSSSINVFVADLPKSLNYGLLNRYWSLDSDSRLGSDADREVRSTNLGKTLEIPPYPENPIIKQYSAEYWIMGDLITPPQLRSGSFAKLVLDARDADVVFVPFFATLSAELQLGTAKGVFRKKDGNEDYQRQREVIDFVKKTQAWNRSGGRDHVFVLTDPVAMWHVKDEIAPAVLLVVDFGGWYRLDSKSSNCSSSEMIQHTQVSVIKDVIVPYTHLLPSLHLSENKKRHNLLYFKGAKHRHRGGLVREKLWDLLINEPGVIMEEGFPNVTGREQSIQVFVAVGDALKPSWLVNHLQSFSKQQKDMFRQNMARAQPMFVYDNGHPGGIGPLPLDGAVNNIWKKVHQKLPMIKEAIIREKRKPPGVLVPRRCQCT
ncbi:unnamed protein product [Vicia faba]|uniref:Exostosin GT47 domain-containing protein n=1 Tax=Vicia faba TaxID=3906 RepID=A0AAV1A180_VICFA|nr:unnamed protein product [Vicia faba]